MFLMSNPIALSSYVLTILCLAKSPVMFLCQVCCVELWLPKDALKTGHLRHLLPKQQDLRLCNSRRRQRLRLLNLWLVSLAVAPKISSCLLKHIIINKKIKHEITSNVMVRKSTLIMSSMQGTFISFKR